MKAQTSIAAMLTMAATFCPAARADDMNLINLQFGGSMTSIDSTLIPPIGSDWASWNFSPGASYSNLALSEFGTSSGISASWSAVGTVTTSAPVPLARGYSFSGLLDSYIYVPGLQTGTITLTGLNAGAEYSLDLITQPDANGAGRQVVFTVDGAGAPQSLTTSASSAAQNSFQLGVNYETFNVYASANGTIVTTFTGVGSDEADVNALELQEIAPASATPEPGTISTMLGGALLCLGAVRRKSRAA